VRVHRCRSVLSGYWVWGCFVDGRRRPVVCPKVVEGALEGRFVVGCSVVFAQWGAAERLLGGAAAVASYRICGNLRWQATATAVRCNRQQWGDRRVAPDLGI
jgi:hypothetical protein